MCSFTCHCTDAGANSARGYCAVETPISAAALRHVVGMSWNNPPVPDDGLTTVAMPFDSRCTTHVRNGSFIAPPPDVDTITFVGDV